jgi:hypothetical protein
MNPSSKNLPIRPSSRRSGITSVAKVGLVSRQVLPNLSSAEGLTHGSVIGVQHHLLAKLFLLEHRIKSSNVGPSDEMSEVEVRWSPLCHRPWTYHSLYQESIRNTVREICGIGRGNQWTPPGMFTACMAISSCKLDAVPDPKAHQ